ncbi:MAG: hypothetical protein R3A80_11090 [Bdellovibrionota bacterium]
MPAFKKLRFLYAFYLANLILVEAGPLEWLGREVNGLDYKVEESQDFSGSFTNIGIGAGFERNQSVDRKSSLLTYRYSLSPSASAPLMVSEAVRSAADFLLPPGFTPFLGVSATRGVTFYRRVEPGLVRSALHFPLTPFQNIPRNADELAPLTPGAKEKFPKGSAMQIPSSTTLSLGLAKSLQRELYEDLSKTTQEEATDLLKDVVGTAKNVANPLDFAILSALSFVFSKNYTLSYDTILTRFEGEGEYVRLQKIVSYSKTLQSQLSFNIFNVLKTRFPFVKQEALNSIANRLASKVIKKVINKLIGVSANLTLNHSQSEEAALWDYTYDLRDPLAREAFDEAYARKGLAPELKVVDIKNPQTPRHQEIKKDFDGPFQKSHEIAMDFKKQDIANPSVIQNFDGSFSRQSESKNFHVSIPFLTASASMILSSSTVSTEGIALKNNVGERDKFKRIPLIDTQRNLTRFEVTRMVDPQTGALIDDVSELKLTHKMIRRNITGNAMRDFTDEIYKYVGGDSRLFPDRYGPLTSLTQKLNIIESDSDYIPWGGEVEAQITVSPLYIALMRRSFLEGAQVAFQHSSENTVEGFEGGTQGILFKYIFNAAIKHLERVARKKGKAHLAVQKAGHFKKLKTQVVGLFTGTDTRINPLSWTTCATQVAQKIALFFMQNHPTPATIDFRLRFYESYPNCQYNADYLGLMGLRDAITEPVSDECSDTYDELGLATILDILEFLPERPEWGPRVTTKISAMGAPVKKADDRPDVYSYYEQDTQIPLPMSEQFRLINDLRNSAGSAYSSVHLQKGAQGGSTCLLEHKTQETLIPANAQTTSSPVDGTNVHSE